MREHCEVGVQGNGLVPGFNAAALLDLVIGQLLVNFSGKTYESFQYGLDPSTGEIDYDEVEKLAKAHNPKMIVAGFSAYSGIVDWEKFREVADAVGAYLLVDMAHVSGLIAADEYPSPIPFADVVTTTTHKTLRLSLIHI